MLLKLTGSSGAGKTTLAFALTDRLSAGGGARLRRSWRPRPADPRWRCPVFDTIGRTPTESVALVERWAADQRAAQREGRLALGPGWAG